MDFKEIKESLLQAVNLVESFEKDSYIIDKEIALEKIRHAYEQLRFGENKQGNSAQSAVEAAVSAALICDQAEDNQADDEPEVEVEFILPDEEDEEEEPEESEEPEEPEEPTLVVEQPLEQSEVAEEPTEPKDEPSDVADKHEQTEEVVFEDAEDTEDTEEVEESTQVEEPEQEPEENPEPEEVEHSLDEVAEEVSEQTFEPEQISEPETEQSTSEEQPEAEQASEPKSTRPQSGVFEQSLFGNDEQWSRPQQSRRKIMALYGEIEPRQEVKQEVAEPVKPEVPHAEAPKADAVEGRSEQILGETIESVPTIGDTILKQRSVAETAPVESLRKAISIADRFMLIRDLFGGDVDMYEEAIDTLDTTDNFDDCIIYITESFSWRPSSEGAKLIVDLLQRKFK